MNADHSRSILMPCHHVLSVPIRSDPCPLQVRHSYDLVIRGTACAGLKFQAPTTSSFDVCGFCFAIGAMCQVQEASAIGSGRPKTVDVLLMTFPVPSRLTAS